MSVTTITVKVKGVETTLPISREDADFVYADCNGKEIKRKKKKPSIPKFIRDVTAHAAGHGGKLVPDRDNPICQKCGLDLAGSQHPYLPYTGPTQPAITLIVDAVSKKEDVGGNLGSGGPVNFIISEMKKVAEAAGLDFDTKQVRIATLTRCARCAGPKVDYKTKGRWCRHFLVQELRDNPPRVIVPVGSVALGMLSHKSSAPDWAGRILTYRGWPDDWVTTKYAFEDHPVLGQKPEMNVAILPILSPSMVWATQSQADIKAWRHTLTKAMMLACSNAPVPNYTRPYFEISLDPARVRTIMLELVQHPRERLTFDTETTGLKQYVKGQSIVYMMFRWRENNQPHCFGFPWDYDGSPLRPYVKELSEYILRAVYARKICGHNIPFDILWLHATLPGADLNRLADSMDTDTMLLLYALKQARGGHGLELVAYDWCPEMAGYEEEMVLFIEKYHDLLSPEDGGHYANWQSLVETEPRIAEAFKAYVMGDVEVADITAERLENKLAEFKGYQIPLASIARRGQFRSYTTPSRSWVHENVLRPAAQTLCKMMGRGMFVDVEAVACQEDLFPKRLRAAIATMADVDPRITAWCENQRATNPGWELDLEKSDQLKTILFRILCLNVQRLTETGIKLYGGLEKCPDVEEQIKYAATDKYTLTRLISENPRLKPLQDYKKLFKAYSGYVRPMRNSFLEGFDKKERSKCQHLMSDGCVHGTFLLTGTRGGRLASKDPNLQQLPHDGEVKKFYTSRFGKRGCLYNGDLSQIELRLLAAACGDPVMVKAYCDDTDLHTLTTSRIFHTDYEVYTKAHMAELQKQGHGDEAGKLDMQRKIGKCVDPDTLASVDGAIIRVGSIHQGRKPDTFYTITDKFVQAPGDNRFVPIRFFYYSGADVKKVLVCAKQGLLACTTKHKLMLSDGRLVCAEDLKKGDELAQVTPLVSKCVNEPIPFNPFNNRIDSGTFKITVTPDLAYVLGLFYGDGCTNANSVCIATGGSEPYFAWQDIIADAVTRCGFTPTIRRTIYEGTKNSGRLGAITGSYGSVVFGSSRVQDVLLQLGAIQDNQLRQKTLKIPGWLLNSTSDIKLSFLAGLIDTDGSVSPYGHASMCTKSWVFAQDILVLSHSIGVGATVAAVWNKTYEKYYYDINFTKTSTYSQLGPLLRYPAKKIRVSKPRFSYSQHKANAVTAIVPLPDGEALDVSVNEPHLYTPNGLTSRQTTNFLTGYGGGPAGLQSTLSENGIYLSLEECENILEGFFDSYPTLKEYLAKYKRFILNHGVAVSITGRVREFNEVFSDDKRLVNKALRAGCNHLIQSTASDMMLTALNAIEFLMRQEGLESILVSTVHDSLLIDGVREEMPKVHAICNEVLNNIPGVMAALFGDGFDLSWTTLLPFNGDFDLGLNYLDMIKVPNNPDWNELFNRLENPVQAL